jgi:tripartite-type tricarboxylate transporter receptor subunit TctC
LWPISESTADRRLKGDAALPFMLFGRWFPGFALRILLHLAAGTVALPAVSRIAKAQAYPSRPIRLVVPFPPGGAFDAMARPWADKIKPLLGTVFIDNIGGAGGSLGAASVAHAMPDGYTLLLGGSSIHTTETLLKSRPLYNPARDFDPIMCLAVGRLAIAVHSSVPATTLKELISYAKANPGKLSYGHTGVGSLNHLAGELFKSLVGIPDLTPVPYRGAGPLLADLISGHVPIGIVAVTGQNLGIHRIGNIRILAVTSPQPLIAAPEVPTAAQAGFPGLTNESSYGLLAPARTPKLIIEQIAKATRGLLTSPDYQKMLIDIGFDATPDSNPEKFREALAADVAFWARVVKALDLKID